MKIEDYLKQQELDLHTPDINRLWQDMDATRKQQKRRSIRWVQLVAASVVILLFTGMLLRHEKQMQQQLTSLSQINEELAKKESDYNQQVAHKWVSYQNMPGAETDIAKDLLYELNLLDTIYNDGLQQIITNGYNERAASILLKTYEQRLRIIERLINEKQKSQRYETKEIELDI